MKQEIMVIAYLGLFTARGSVSAAPVTVDFGALTNEVDITIDASFDGYPIDGVRFIYDNFGLEEKFAHIDSFGIHGSIGGILIFNFETPAAQLNFDFSMSEVESSAVPLLEGLYVILYHRQAEVANLPVATDAFAPYPDDPLYGDASGHFVYSGDAFDQAILYFASGGAFSVTNVVYEPVPPPSITIDVIDRIAQLTINDAAGMVNGIDASTNLIDWTTIATITNLTGAITYDATNFQDSSLEFFRCYH